MLEIRNITINGKQFKETISVLKDFQGNILKEPYMKIKKKGTFEIYDKAIDLPNSNYEYEETNEVIEEEHEEVVDGENI